MYRAIRDVVLGAVFLLLAGCGVSHAELFGQTLADPDGPESVRQTAQIAQSTNVAVGETVGALDRTAPAGEGPEAAAVHCLPVDRPVEAHDDRRVHRRRERMGLWFNAYFPQLRGRTGECRAERQEDDGRAYHGRNIPGFGDGGAVGHNGPR